ncbi:unnamed protein product [Caenorhabditis auriculariae]|uniref:Ig-like domain-containing protein n=1 Tax=Caenorhabditis auriculariae TaxID=2777116 RepID=A0A8S1HQH2_9PELO|nr:unnamed protein product [Caenorhabditis auriculariae]
MLYHIFLGLFLIFSVNAKSLLDQEFDQFGKCLLDSEKTLGNEVHVKVMTVTRGSDVVLPCFTCVSPEDGIEIETTYKPSAGAIGRMASSAVDFFKERLLKSTFSMPDKDRWKFDWEFAPIGKRFSQLSSMHRTSAEKVSDKINRFLNREDAKFGLGDRYELLLKSVTANQTGYFRCANRHLRNVVSNTYFLEVITKKKFNHIEGELGSNAILKDVDLTSGEFGDLKLKYETKASEWSSCSYCSQETGEETRNIQCLLKPSVPPNLLPSEASWILLFGVVPCSSSLVPIELRKHLKSLGNDVVHIEHRPCWEDCKTQAAVGREVKSPDELGEFRVMDYLPAGEYLFGELLPRILPPVARKVILVVEGDSLVMTCQRIYDVSHGVHWFSMKRGLLQQSNLKETYSDRAYFDDDWRLIFDAVTMQDDDQYYCYSSQNVLLSTFHVRVMENDKSRELVELMRMFVKFVAFLFIFSLIANQLFQ